MYTTSIFPALHSATSSSRVPVSSSPVSSKCPLLTIPNEGFSMSVWLTCCARGPEPTTAPTLWL